MSEPSVALEERTLVTRRGIESRVLEAGVGAGRPLIYLHGAGGLYPREPLLERLAKTRHVVAPEWPGYGSAPGEEKLEDMLDFALHGWDVIAALELDPAAGRPDLLGHSMGGMIAAEMACLNPDGIEKLVLVGAAGLWLDDHPIPDLFAMLPFELAPVLFKDPAQGVKLLTGGVDFSDMDALKAFMIGNARRLGTAGKILFPIPNRRVSKRLYRQTAATLVVWGVDDRFIVPAYAERWVELLPSAELAWIEAAGHMAPYEQPNAVAEAVEKFLQ